MFNFINTDGIPTLPRRENNIDKFCMYLILDTQNGRFTLQWKYQPYLKRNMELYQQMNHVFSKLCSQRDKGIGLAQFWRNVLLSEAQSTSYWEPQNKEHLAWEHLASYFEEKCYWTAKKICKVQNEHSWEEYLYLAKLMIYNPLTFKEIVSKYDYNQANLDTYISEVLEKNVKYEAEVNRFSRWRLLCKKSDRELKEALEVIGHSQPDIFQLLFARKYFKQVYLFNKIKSSNRKIGKKWLDPDREDFEKAAQCYNAEKMLPSAPHEVSANSTYVTGEQIQASMEICIFALQNYPKSILSQFSIDALQAIGREAKSEVEEDFLELECQEALIKESVEDEQQGLTKATNLALLQQLDSMKPDYQKLLLLYYGFGLSQQQLAVKLGINQSSVSRYLTKSIIKMRISGFATHRQLKNQGTYDRCDRTYSLKIGQLTEDLTLLLATLGLHLQEDVPSFKTLSEAKARELLVTLSDASIYSPRLRFDVAFSQWAAIVANEQWRQHLYDRRLGRQEVLSSQASTTTSITSAPLSTSHSPPENTLVNLTDWFQQLFEAGWQSVDELLNTRLENLAFDVRSFSISQETAVNGVKLIDLGMHLSGQTLALLLAISQELDEKIGVLVQVHPTGQEKYLPSHLKLMLLESGNVVQTVQSRSRDYYIQLNRFKGLPGACFSIQLALGNFSITEDFSI